MENGVKKGICKSKCEKLQDNNETRYVVWLGGGSIDVKTGGQS